MCVRPCSSHATVDAKNVASFVACWHRQLLCVQEDAYDAVKTNMFELLAAVADQCQPSQLDMLFGKLERSQVRNAKEGQRLLTLLAKLAEGDTQVCSGLASQLCVRWVCVGWCWVQPGR